MATTTARVRPHSVSSALAVEDEGDGNGKVGHGELVAAGEVAPECLGVYHDERLGLFQAAGRHLRPGEAADRDGTVQRPVHIHGGDRPDAVVGRVAQLESAAHAVAGDLSGFSKFGLQRVDLDCAAGVAGKWNGLEADEAVVALQRDAVHGWDEPRPCTSRLLGPFSRTSRRVSARLAAGCAAAGPTAGAAGKAVESTALHGGCLPVGWQVYRMQTMHREAGGRGFTHHAEML